MRLSGGELRRGYIVHRWGQGKIHHSAERLIPSLLELLLLKVAAPRENLLVHVEHTDRVGNDAEEVGRHAAVQRLDALFPEDEIGRAHV